MPEDKTSIEQELYRKNVEFDHLNELLSFTRELYQISLLSLDPSTLAEKMATTLREKLRLEMSGIFLFDRKEDTLTPIVFSKSERLIAVLRKSGFLFRDVVITGVSQRPVLKSIFDGTNIVTGNLSDIWGGLVKQEYLNEITTTANLKTLIIYPLLTEERIIGVVLLAYTSPFDQISQSEKDSLKSFSDIIAVALDKSYTYRELDSANKNLEKINKEMSEANKELKTIDETKSSILSFTSHHLQNPLQNIVMASSMLADGSFGEIGEKPKSAIVKMFESARHLSLTVKLWIKALDFEEGRVTYKIEKFDIEKLVSSMMKDWDLVAKERKLEFTFETDGHPPYIVNGDQTWLRDVILNLIDNSFKMTEKGSIKVKLEKLGIEKVRFSVTDSGVGIDGATMPILFQKFKKGQEGWQKDIEGTGLGLYICKKIITEGHNGKIWAESEGLGKGATFLFEVNV
ncbi:MAG: GAF domain-containing sensor histidine kinase [Candidatus Nomurabacteria bacterium]|nr:GAF domain-containing sensor histidine kinase [Candidatus Nomurabacteria bacterium]